MPNAHWNRRLRQSRRLRGSRRAILGAAQFDVRLKSGGNSTRNWYASVMTRLQELTQEALRLTDAERAVLATDLLETLPGVLSDEDEGVAEALRRDAELEADPSKGVEWSALKKELGR
jgi:hypothetical protein